MNYHSALYADDSESPLMRLLYLLWEYRIDNNGLILKINSTTLSPKWHVEYYIDVCLSLNMNVRTNTIYIYRRMWYECQRDNSLCR